MKKTMTNEELLEKAVIEADALASAGEIPVQEANKFLDYVIDETALKGNARIVKIAKGDKWRVNKIGVGARNAVPAVAGQDPGVRRGVTTSAVDLQTAEVMLPFDIGDGFVERNVEQTSARDHVVRLMATSLSNDLEELWVNGDLLGPARIQDDLFPGGDAVNYVADGYIGLFDGLLRLADSGQVVDAQGANMGVSLMRQAITALPTKYRRNRRDLRFMAPSDIFELWRERVASRGTAAGDLAMGGGSVPKPFGLEGVDLALLPFRPRVVEHVVLNSTTATSLRYAPLQNAVVTPSTLAGTPTAEYSSSTDYVLDATLGTLARTGGSTIGDGDTVKVTYESNPQIIVTHKSNIILAVSRDIRIERDRNIHRRVSEYVISTKVGIALEDVNSVVKIKNVGTGV
jgi:hypothetical protein